MKYVYQVIEHGTLDNLYFSSWIKAFNYCKNRGCFCRSYEDNYITQLHDYDKTKYFDIRKNIVR